MTLNINNHFLVSGFHCSNISDKQKTFSRTGLILKKRVLSTGFMALLGQCCTLPWLFVIFTCQPGILGPLGYLTPLRSFQWWIIAACVIAAYLVCLCVLRKFLLLCLLPFSSEIIRFSPTAMFYEKRLLSVSICKITLVFAVLHNVTVVCDESFEKKYWCIYPVPDQNYISSYGKEYCVQFWSNKSLVVCIDTLFEDELHMILDALRCGWQNDVRWPEKDNTKTEAEPKSIAPKGRNPWT